MAVIKSGATSDLLTIDPTSKAARTSLYDSSGLELSGPPYGSYMAQIDLRPGAIVAGASVALWSMRNLSSRTAYLRRLKLFAGYFAATVTATVAQFGLARFRTATPTGGNAITVVPKRTSYGSSGVTDVRQIAPSATAGLTTTGVAFDAVFAFFGYPRQPVTTYGAGGFMVSVDLPWKEALEPFSAIELAPNDGLAILIPNIATVAGDFVNGMIEWDEE